MLRYKDGQIYPCVHMQVSSKVNVPSFVLEPGWCSWVTVFIMLPSFCPVSSININAAVTSVSKSTTWVIVPVYYLKEPKENNAPVLLLCV